MSNFFKNIYINGRHIFALSIILSFQSCSAFVNVNQNNLYNAYQDFNLHQPLINEDSPFSTLVRNAFSSNSHDKSANESLHYVQLLDVGNDALLARIHLIRSAQKSIYVQTFIWRNDESGRFIIDELIKASQRGVEIYVIVDKLGLEDDPRLIDYFTRNHPNIHLKIYNPSTERVAPSALHMAGQLAFKFKKINQRMHNKIMVFDDQIAITGGRNIENDYFDRGETRNFKDRDILIVGPVVKEMTQSFSQYWAFKWSVPSNEFVDVMKLMKDSQFKNMNKPGNSEEMFKDIELKASDYDFIKGRFVDDAYSVNKVLFMYDLPGKNKRRDLTGGGKVAGQIMSLINLAKDSLVFQTPYLVLEKKSMRVFKKLRKDNKNLKFLVSTNSLAATDKIYVYAYSFKQRKKLVKKLRFEIFEFKPIPLDMAEFMHNDLNIQVKKTNNNNVFKQLGTVIDSVVDKRSSIIKRKYLCVHAKSFVVDNAIAWVGSFNLDPRSIHLNTEVGLAVWDKEVARVLKGNILKDMAQGNSWTVGKKKDVPIISRFSGLIGAIAENVPVVDVWPFQYTSLFELKEGAQAVPFYDEQFYNNYSDIGSFPGVGLSLSQIQLRLIEALGSVAEPLI